MHLRDWDNEFALICLFLHELQRIRYDLPCLAFERFPVKSGQTGWHPTRILTSGRSSTERSGKHFNILIYAHTTSRTLPTCDISLGSLTVAMPAAGDFVESLDV